MRYAVFGMGIIDRTRAIARQLLAQEQPQAPAQAPQVAPVADHVDPNFLARNARTFVHEVVQSTSALLNLVTGAGTHRDSTYYNQWATPRVLSENERAGMGRNALIAQALTKLPNTATREGWRVKITDERVEDGAAVADEIAAYEKKRSIPKHCGRADAKARQYGQALVVLGIQDGRPMSEPVDLDNVRTIQWAAVIDVRSFRPHELFQVEDENFTKVRTFHITDVNGFLEDGLRYGPNSLSSLTQTLDTERRNQGGQLIIHADRVLHFHTVDFLSVLDTLQEPLGAFFESMHGIRTAARESSMVIYKVGKQLRKAWSENSGLAQSHMSLVDRAKGVMNALVIDKDNEEVEMKSRSLAGLADVANPAMVFLTAALATPVTVFFGVSPGGFGKGEAERETWHEEVRAEFENAFEANLHKLHGYILVAKDGCNLPFDTQREIELNDLSPPDEETRSKLRSEAVDDLTKAYEKGGITRDEYRAAIAQIDDDYFRVTLTEEGKRVTKDALVGAIDGTVKILTAVGQGLIPAESAEIALSRLIPSSFDPEAAAEIMAPIKSRQVTAPTTPALATSTATGAAPGDIEDDSDGEEEVDELEIAWSEAAPPPDAQTAKKLAASGELGNITGREITLTAKAGLIPTYRNLLNKPVYSLAEVKAALLRRNGKLPTTTDKVRDAEPGLYTLVLVLRAPKDVARWVPYKGEEPSAPHVTLLYVGKIEPSKMIAIVDAVRRVMASAPPLRIDFDSVGYFDNEQRVAFARVLYTAELLDLHDALRAAVAETGVEIKQHPGPYTPHMTLAYLPPGEPYDGPYPAHGWTATEIEIWYDTLALPIACGEQSAIAAPHDESATLGIPQ